MNSEQPPYLVPGLPPGSEVQGVLRLMRLAADLGRYASGHPPTDGELDAAPLISNWRSTLDICAIRLAGTVSDHPLVHGPTATTSRIYALDRDMRWVRTYSRLWRLGSPG